MGHLRRAKGDLIRKNLVGSLLEAAPSSQWMRWELALAPLQIKNPMGISPSLSNHRLGTAKRLNRPRPTVSMDEQQRPNNYSCFSSSPPKARAATPPESEPKPPPPGLKAQPAILSLVRPATTMHRTSMSVAQGLNGAKRTLGVKRSMNGWSSGKNQPFVPPTIRRPEWVMKLKDRKRRSWFKVNAQYIKKCKTLNCIIHFCQVPLSCATLWLDIAQSFQNSRCCHKSPAATLKLHIKKLPSKQPFRMGLNSSSHSVSLIYPFINSFTLGLFPVLICTCHLTKFSPFFGYISTFWMSL